MRTFDEIYADIKVALSNNDFDALVSLAEEMLEIGTAEAEAMASRARAWAYLCRADYPLALQHGHRALTRYKELGDGPSIAIVYSYIGTLNLRTGNYPAALEQFHRALAMHEELGNRSGMASATSSIGSVHQHTGDYPAALEYLRRALAMHEELGDRIDLARTTGNLGIVYTKTGDYPAALEHHHRSLAVYEELGDRIHLASVTGNIGAVYSKTGDFSEALGHYHRALALFEELGDRNGVASITGNIGNVYAQTRDFPHALSHFQGAVALHGETGNLHGVASVTHSIGTLHANTGNYPAALDHYHRALKLHTELGERSGVVHVIGDIVSALLATEQDSEAQTLLEEQSAMYMSDPRTRAFHHANRAITAERSGNLDGAREHLMQALAIVREAGARDPEAQCHHDLRDLAQKRNDFAGYIEHNAEYLRITEEIRGKEATQKMAMMEAQRGIESERRERDKERALLYGTLPKSVADRMIRGEKITGDHYDNASVIFLDIVGFTSISDKIPPGHVVHLLNHIFSTLDDVCRKHGVTKIKTIGDSYMAVAGVPDVLEDHAQRAALCAMEMLAALNALEISMPPELGDTSWIQNVGEIQVRIGIHCGAVTAGVIGTERLQYDVWGDTVNVASRMESTGEPGRIHVTEAFALGATPDEFSFRCIERGTIDIKGKGLMKTYWLGTV